MKPSPSSDDPHEIAYFAGSGKKGSLPTARTFVLSCPKSVQAKMFAILTAVAEAPPKRFSGGGYWEAMHGSMEGWFEVRASGPGRSNYRLFCLLDYEAGGFDKPLLVIIAAREMWQLLLKAGGEDVVPSGLACRDTLRLEAGMPLYGQELDRDHNPYEAGFSRVVRLDRETDFVGKAALVAIEAAPIGRKLIGLQGEGKRAARHGYTIHEVGKQESIGEITSGALSPTLGFPVALAYAKTSANIEVGTVLEVDIRGTRTEFTVVSTPFYKRQK